MNWKVFFSILHRRTHRNLITIYFIAFRSFVTKTFVNSEVTTETNNRIREDNEIKGKIKTVSDDEALINDKTCGIIFETIQGEGGLYPSTKEFAQGVKKLCVDKDILLILDEIQCGMGRTGKMFAYEDYDIEPDVITCAKALGCGIPVGAFAVKNKAVNVIEPGDHGTTYGGNPLIGAAVNAVFDIFEEDKVLDNVRNVGAYLEMKLDELVNKYDFIKERRGKGFMQGLEFDHEVGKYIIKAQELGLIVISAGPNVLRFLPPLVIEKKHVDEMIEIIEKVIS